MKYLYLSLVCVFVSCASQELKQDAVELQEISFLALGDSYTIGEGVEKTERWPNQFVSIAKEKGVLFSEPDVVAKTGWKTYDLLSAIQKKKTTKKYDFITLLIGVNNQYNALPLEIFKEGLDSILFEINNFKKANATVLIISIPDWGVTPYAKSFEPNKISQEIDVYNALLESFAKDNGFPFVDVTTISRRTSEEGEFLTSDSLHPSSKMYEAWAKKIFDSYSKKK